MSLNGLDEAAIVEAHQAALAEAGGWFLVKYASRDTVTLLSRGIGGVVETRLAVEHYEEKSPLYGLMQYRRKKIILKFVPEGTSRLLQVRLTVQFQTVLETLIPHDTVFSFTSPEELTESALSSACMLGTRAQSMKSSSSSLRRRRLNEISEGVEEPGLGRNEADTAGATTTLPTASPGAGVPTGQKEHNGQEQTKPVKQFLERLQPPSRGVDSWARTVEAELVLTVPANSLQRATSSRLASISSTVDKSLPTTPQTKYQNVKGGEIDGDQPSPRLSDVVEPELNSENPSRYRRQSLGDSEQGSLYSAFPPSYAVPKPKKKFAPRPHVEAQSRPKTSGSAKNSGTARPVANLPTSVQIANRASSVASFRPDSRQSSRSVPTQFVDYTALVLPPPLPSPSNVHIVSLYKPPQGRPAPLRPLSQSNPLSLTATPEKLRLMKALQMRKKNMMVAQRASALSYMSSNNASVDVPVQTGRSSSIQVSKSPVDGVKAQLHSSKQSDEFHDNLDPMSSTASPISLTHLSEKPSTKSSFTTDNDERASRSSISSDTGSSITPKADVKDAKRRRSSTTTKGERGMRSQSTPRVDGPSEEEIPPSPQTTVNESHARNLNIEDVVVEIQKMEPPKHSLVETEHAKLLAALNNKDLGGNDKEAGQPLSPGSKSAVQESRPISTLHQRSSNASQKAAELSTFGMTTPETDRKRRGLLDPLQGEPSAGTSDISDDESFMDELQHAKVEEAKPVSVARTPATPIYSRGSSDRLKELSRATSSPDSQKMETPSPERPKTGSMRSVSSNLPQWPPTNVEAGLVPLAKKGTLSSGISKRIKALEVFSSRDSLASPTSTTQVLAPKSSRLTMSSFRKRSSFMPQQQPPNTSISTLPPKELPVPEITPALEPDISAHPVPWVHRQGSSTEINTPTQKEESISVTARIIRDRSVPEQETNADPTEPVIMNLQRSTLVIEQNEKQDSIAARPNTHREISFQDQEATTKSPRSERTRFSFTSNRSVSQPRLHTSDSMASRMSFASKKSEITIPRSISDNSSITEEKRSSRASRLKKRMSALSTGSRRNLLGALSPKKKENRLVTTIAEQSEDLSRLPSDADSMAHVVNVGDLNVQFPDTLLWKRRFMRIDDEGNVIFSPPAMERNPRGISRTFHLSDFKKPTLPDNEREEMLWSIKLELTDGGCIQCACESRYAQQQVLTTLINAHAAYHLLYSN